MQTSSIIVLIIFNWLMYPTDGRVIRKDNESTGAELTGESSQLEATAYNVRQTNDPGSYVFGYDNAFDSEGNEHFRYEERFANGTVIGEYGFVNYLESVVVTVTYIADEKGYRPTVKIRYV